MKTYTVQVCVTEYYDIEVTADNESEATTLALAEYSKNVLQPSFVSTDIADITERKAR